MISFNLPEWKGFVVPLLMVYRCNWYTSRSAPSGIPFRFPSIVGTFPVPVLVGYPYVWSSYVFSLVNSWSAFQDCLNALVLVHFPLNYAWKVLNLRNCRLVSIERKLWGVLVTFVYNWKKSSLLAKFARCLVVVRLFNNPVKNVCATVLIMIQ